MAVGHPAEQVIHRAEVDGIDLIILGRRGRSMIARMMLGSVSERALRYAHWSGDGSSLNWIVDGGIHLDRDEERQRIDQVERLVGDHVSPAEQEGTIRRDLEGLESARTEPTVAS